MRSAEEESQLSTRPRPPPKSTPHRQHFYTDAINGALGHELKYRGSPVLSSVIRVGYRSVNDERVPLKSAETESLQSAWKTYTLRFGLPLSPNLIRLSPAPPLFILLRVGTLHLRLLHGERLTRGRDPGRTSSLAASCRQKMTSPPPSWCRRTRSRTPTFGRLASRSSSRRIASSASSRFAPAREAARGGHECVRGK